MVFMPPRHGKSTLLSQYFPAWFLGRWPDKRVILASYEADFASSWGRKARDVLEEFGPSVFGVELRGDSKAAGRWQLAGHAGEMISAGIGGPITGRGADCLIIDDPVKNSEEARSPTVREKHKDWYRSVATTRLEPGASEIIIQTRWHADDLGGWLEQKGKEDAQPWEVVRLPAIALENDQLGRRPGDALWPERYPIERLLEIQQATEAYWWGCLYQQEPGAEGGAEWPDTYFGPELWFDDWPTDLLLRVLSLDPSKGKDAKHGDYSAFIMMGLGRDGVLWIDADLARRPTPTIVEDGIRLYREWNPQAIAIETNVFQELLAVEFARVGREQRLTLPIYGINNTAKKEVRIRQIGPYLAQKRIRIRATLGGKMLVKQLRDFPNGEFNDAPDALQMALVMADYLLGVRPKTGAPEVLQV